MALPQRSYGEPLVPKARDKELAALSSQKLATLFGQAGEEDPIEITIGGKETLRLPYSVVQFLFQVLSQMAQGNAIALIPVHSYLTTQEAADLLHVSRPYLIKLLESGVIPFEKVGTHRRIRAEELLCYQNEMEKEKERALDELTEQAQELDMGY